MACLACKRDKEIAARGLCRACYQRWHKTGSTEYQRWGRRSVCEIMGCNKPVVSHGFCDTHRKRLERHGHTDQTRPDSWGAIEKHPLMRSWRYLLRTPERICREWRGDFLQFVVDVGDRPSPKHKLFPADETKPIGPNNFVWKRAITERVPGEDIKTFLARRQRVYRVIKEEEYKGYDLTRRLGLAPFAYESMAEFHNHRCAICGQAETAKMRGKPMRLAVDHCHTTGDVRGLLCVNCNKGLGHFKDNPEILRRAIAYLGRKRSK